MSTYFPKKAKKVFSGVIFDVYQWEQHMYDGSTATFERLTRLDSAEIIAVTKEGNILIQRQQQPDKDNWFLCLNGGGIEKDEDPLEGAKRELLEESGYTSDDWKLLNTFTGFSKLHWNLHVYVARDCTYVQDQQLDSGERIEIQEVTFDAFIDFVERGEMQRVAPYIREQCIRAKYDEASYLLFKKNILGGL